MDSKTTAHGRGAPPAEVLGRDKQDLNNGRGEHSWEGRRTTNIKSTLQQAHSTWLRDAYVTGCPIHRYSHGQKKHGVHMLVDEEIKLY